MRNDLWQKADRLLGEVMDLPVGERTTFLDRACQGDEALRHEVTSLMAADQAADGFLENPAFDLDLKSSSGDDKISGRLGPYRLLRILGQGGMATVYLAERDDEEYRQQVAIKVIRSDLHQPGIRQRFRRERQILARLKHSAIAHLYDGGTTREGRLYLVMEYVDGLPIDVYCDRNGLSFERRLALFSSVCDAVQYAHRNLLVHRDIKPANILVTADGAVKLLDFGIAKLLGGEPLGLSVARTQTGQNPMTPLYASPEQVAGETITTASDVYSLGVLLHQVLTGRSPYRNTRALPGALEREILEGELARPSDLVDLDSQDAGLRKRLRGDLDNILLKALRKAPERRYGSVQQFFDDIARHLSDRPVRARPDTPGYRLGKFLRRNSLATAAVGTIALLLIVFSLITRQQSRRLEEERDVARMERQKARQNSDFFMGLFDQADPAQSQGRDLTVRTVLDQGRSHIGRFSGAPELRAAYMHTIGKVYLGLGLQAEARPLLEEAYQIRRDLHGNNHMDVAHSLHDLSLTVQQQGDVKAALPLARESLAIRRELFEENHLEVITGLHRVAYFVHHDGDYAGAKALFEEAVALGRETLDEDHPRMIKLSNDLGNLWFDMGDYDRALRSHEAALAGYRKLYGEIHPRVASSLNNLAVTLGDMGKFEESLAYYQESVATKRQLYGDESPNVAGALNNIAFVLYEKKDYEAAEKLYREALEIYRQSAPEHPAIAGALSNFGLTRKAQGDLEEAESLLRESLVLRRRLIGDEHPHVTTTLYNLALVLGSEEEGYAEATELYREVLKRDLRDFGEDNPNYAISLTGLGQLLKAQARCGEAEPLLRQALDVFRQKLPEDHWRTAHAEGVLNECLGE